ADLCQRITNELKECRAAADHDDSFQDLLEHNNADGDDEVDFNRLACDQRVIQPVVTWLANSRFSKEQAILFVSLDNHCSALAGVGWVKSANIVPMNKNVTSLPSGVLIGDEIKWAPGWGRVKPDYTRQRSKRPDIKVEVKGSTVIVSLDIDVASLGDS